MLSQRHSASVRAPKQGSGSGIDQRCEHQQPLDLPHKQQPDRSRTEQRRWHQHESVPDDHDQRTEHHGRWKHRTRAERDRRARPELTERVPGRRVPCPVEVLRQGNFLKRENDV